MVWLDKSRRNFRLLLSCAASTWLASKSALLVSWWQLACFSVETFFFIAQLIPDIGWCYRTQTRRTLDRRGIVATGELLGFIVADVVRIPIFIYTRPLQPAILGILHNFSGMG